MDSCHGGGGGGGGGGGVFSLSLTHTGLAASHGVTAALGGAGRSGEGRGGPGLIGAGLIDMAAAPSR